MDDGVVDAGCLRFFSRKGFAVRQQFPEALPQGKVAAGVFIKQGIVEQKTAGVHRRLFGDDCSLAEHAGAFVHMNHLLQQFLAFFRPARDGAPCFKADGEIFNQLAVPAQRLHGDQCALAAARLWRSKDFFRRHIGNIIGSVLFVDAARRFPGCFRNQFHTEISPVCTPVLQPLKVLRIQPAAFFLQQVRVRFP